MIPAAEIQRIAGAAGVEPTRVDLDYALAWILCGLWDSQRSRRTGCSRVARASGSWSRCLSISRECLEGRAALDQILAA
jgi:hypothetical protein